MADLSVTPVASGIKLQPGMSLADMAAIARNAQAYQQSEQINPLALQEAQQKVRVGQIGLGVEEQKDIERRAVQRFMADPKNYTNPDGTYNPDVALKGLTSIAPLTGLAHFKDLASSFGAQETTKKAATETQSTQMDFANKQVLGIANRLTPLINHPLIIAAEQNPQSVNPDAVGSLLKNYGNEQASALGMSKDKADPLIQPYLEQAKNPAGVRQFLKDKLLATLDQGSRVTAMQPSGIGVQHGAGGYTASTGEFSQYRPGQVIPGTEYVAQPTPTTELTAVAGDKTGLPPGTKYMIGPKRVQPMGEAGTVTGATEANQPTMVSGLNPAQAKGIENFGDYQKGLTARVGASNQFMTRSAELKELLTEFKPGAGSSTLQGVAQKMQALGAPQDLVDRIAGGDLSAAQSFNKFLAQSVIAGIRQAAGGDQTRVAEVENYIKNNPSIDTDPRALKRFIDFTEKQASRDILEQKLLNQAIKDNTFRPETWIGDLQQKFENTGILPKTTFPTSTPSGKPSTQGRTVVKSGFYKGKPVVQYSDGSIEYK